ncbi:tetratricopeptide repeat protein [Heliophilum fasciatum]|uniref:Tetratricopeptide repeat protein n=1 Tax=Heliophilum fasciatum TaxID=35700 RepID=A0A4R2RI34_9FIRM|nr:tetratricopeptide repeat protein [Heliophilum fasciatum]MCW2278941.1 putative Zn-dependent protease [Heliophilum fasciatum]TCP61807.1 tetratricopeptide repeat protein [Heliophilum fasciatum]
MTIAIPAITAGHVTGRVGYEGVQLRAIKMALHHWAEYGKCFSKYNVILGTELAITEKIKVRIMNDRLGLELLAAEVYQEHGQPEAAIDLLEKSAFHSERVVRLSLGELYFQGKEYEKCIKELQRIENNDNAGTVALLYQGIAFRELGHLGPAIEVFRMALRRKKERDEEVLTEIWYELAKTLIQVGEKKKAKKELEAIMLRQVDYQDVRALLETLA